MTVLFLYCVTLYFTLSYEVFQSPSKSLGWLQLAAFGILSLIMIYRLLRINFKNFKLELFYSTTDKIKLPLDLVLVIALAACFEGFPYILLDVFSLVFYPPLLILLVLRSFGSNKHSSTNSKTEGSSMPRSLARTVLLSGISIAFVNVVLNLTLFGNLADSIFSVLIFNFIGIFYAYLAYYGLFHLRNSADVSK